MRHQANCKCIIARFVSTESPVRNSAAHAFSRNLRAAFAESAAMAAKATVLHQVAISILTEFLWADPKPLTKAHATMVLPKYSFRSSPVPRPHPGDDKLRFEYSGCLAIRRKRLLKLPAPNRLREPLRHNLPRGASMVAPGSPTTKRLASTANQLQRQ